MDGFDRIMDFSFKGFLRVWCYVIPSDLVDGLLCRVQASHLAFTWDYAARGSSL